ncbi:MAG: hypothetical protein IRZ13_16955 [Acetobacteraceae bacterium]|nr:hypothetical protein [Acetobacteraceae bacterium]
MRLTNAEMQRFHAEGWRFSPEEVAVLREATVTRLVEEDGTIAPTGNPGEMLMLHGNLVHGLALNITPCRARSSS